jgi:hypothetical protein
MTGTLTTFIKTKTHLQIESTSNRHGAGFSTKLRPGKANLTDYRTQTIVTALIEKTFKILPCISSLVIGWPNAVDRGSGLFQMLHVIEHRQVYRHEDEPNDDAHNNRQRRLQLQNQGSQCPVDVLVEKLSTFLQHIGNQPHFLA